MNNITAGKKHRCNSCGTVFGIIGDGICSCGGILEPVPELKAPEIPLHYPELFHPPKITHDEYCQEKFECEFGRCDDCERIFKDGAQRGKADPE